MMQNREPYIIFGFAADCGSIDKDNRLWLRGKAVRFYLQRSTAGRSGHGIPR